MTRAELLTTLARRLNKNTTLDTATQNRLLDFLNETHRELLAMPGSQRLRDSQTSFATVASQTTYALVNVARILRIFEPDDRRVLREISRDQWRQLSPDVSTLTGTPDSFVWLGSRAVAKQPADASSIFVKSTSASDTGTCYLEGEITGGYPRSVSVSMTGTTAVDVSSAISTWERVTKWYLSAVAVGTVTLHEDSGAGTELGRIGIGRAYQPYTLIALHPTPDAVATYQVDYQPEVTDLAQSNDVPFLPLDFHDLLVYGAMTREYEHMNDSRLQVAAARYQQRLAQFKYYLAETAQGGDVVGFEKPSRLGAWVASGV